MNITLQRVGELKQELTDFVLDAEGDLATALESYTAQRLTQFSKTSQQTTQPMDLVVDEFLVEGKVGVQAPWQLFLEQQANLAAVERLLIQNWQRSFTGLFAVTQVLTDGFELMNWLTTKHYQVKPTALQSPDQLARLAPGEILITRIAPVSESVWMFSGPLALLGKLGKPKLAVAIGNFKDNHKRQLYGDAPELLEEAWRSVERYFQDFIDFFGGDEVTLPGYQLQKKFTEFQEQLTQKQLAAAGFDEHRSLEELAEQAGVSQEEVTEAAEAMGADAKAVAQLFQSGKTPRMVTPQVKLPDTLQKAAQVTVITHPRWGQMLLTNYHQLTTLLESQGEQSQEQTRKLLSQYLKDPTINAHIWARLKQNYPNALEQALKNLLERPDFTLEQDLDHLLSESGHPLEPELPEIASVPIHLHTLFQEALAEVSTDKSKNKAKQKTTSGFKPKK